MITHRTLYKRDSKGEIRIWFIEQDGASYRYVTGLQTGAHTRSDFTVAVPKSKATAELQADFEVSAAYEHQLKRDYFETIEEVDTPRFFSPMLAHKYESFPGACYTQPKLDGIRCIASAKGLFSREGQPILAVPHIAEALAPVFEANPDLVLDGELYNHDLKDDFNKISSLVRKKKPTDADLAKSAELIQYHVYDIPSDGHMSFSQRFLHDGLTGIDFVKIVPSWPVANVEALDTFYGEYLKAGYEGQMVRLDGPYEQKRSKRLLKRKEFQDAEYDLVEIQEGVGNWSGCAKAVLCRLPDGRTFGAGIKGTKDFAKKLLAEADRYDRVTIKFFELTPDGIPRFGVATQFHEKGPRL